MKYINTPWLTTIALVGFIWLAHESCYHIPHVRNTVGYTHSVFTVIDHVPRMSAVRAKQLQELYSITDDEIAKPVALFGEPSE
jgi:hypothetical protein